jgi:uncharacterized protein (TIGR02145 family)
MQPLTQTLNINVANTPSIPDAGGLTNTNILSGLLSPTAIVLSILGLAFLLLIIARLLTRSGKTTTKRTIHKVTTISLLLLPLLTLPTIAIISNTHSNTQATSNLSSVTPTIDINIYKDKASDNNNQAEPITKTATSTTTVTTDNTTGYTLSAKLSPDSANNQNNSQNNNIIITLNNETLTTDSIDIYADDTNTSPSTYDHAITVTVPQDIQLGAYTYDIIYSIIENPANIPTTMQTMTRDYCDNMTLNEIIVLEDTRNNQEYRVRKLADDNCWMIDNLALELTDGMTLASDTTNVSEPEPKTIDFAWSTFENGSGTHNENFVTGGYLTTDGSSSSGVKIDAWRQVNPSDPNMSGSTNCRNNIGDSDNGNISYNTNSKTKCGYLYNFYTATASTVDNAKATQYLTADGSICPAAWRLPTGTIADTDTASDFQNLDVKYGGTGGYRSANLAAQGLWLSAGAWQGTYGGYYGSVLGDQGSGADYWSSSVSSAGYAYDAYFYDGNFVGPGTGNYSRHNGFAVRCLLN